MDPAFPQSQKRLYTLIYTAFIAGLCSIVYELLIATTISYFLGDSVKYFSITIGLYMAAMGAGSYLSKYIDGNLLQKFVVVELLLGFLGGASVPTLYLAYAYTESLIPIYIFLTCAVGFLIGLEIPFLARLMEDYNKLKFNIANILSFDYLGALVATLSFPFLLLPYIGVYKSSLLFGLINLSLGFIVLLVFRDEIGQQYRQMRNINIVLAMSTASLIGFSGFFLQNWNQALYEDRIVHSEQTPYQKIVLTKHRNDVRLFLDGNLQFSSVDEYRYHEALIHVPMSLSTHPIRRVLLLGAGDGLAVRELLKHKAIQEIVLVDLDQALVQLAKSNPHLVKLNERSLFSPIVHIEIGDAFSYLQSNQRPFDLIVSDLPDPNNASLARLYSKQFFQLTQRNLSPAGLFVSQATSPYFAKEAFWSISKTVRESGFQFTHPYQASVPSFGNWGFVLASRESIDIAEADLEIDTRYLEADIIPHLFNLEKDVITSDVEVNTLDRPILLSYYLDGWRNFAR